MTGPSTRSTGRGPSKGKARTQATVGYILALAGRRAEAQRITGEFVERDRMKEEGAAGGAAVIYAGLGQNDPAFEWLNRARAARPADRLLESGPEVRQASR